MRGWCRARLAAPGSNTREWQDYVVDTVEGQVKAPTDRVCVEKVLNGLYELGNQTPDLCKPNKNLSRYMYTRGQLSDADGVNSVEVDTVLWDTGNGGSSCISEKFCAENQKILEPMTEEENSSIFLADAKTELKITKRVRGVLTVLSPDGASPATIDTVYSVIPMGCNIILGLRDIIFQAPDMLVSMIQRASKEAILQSAVAEAGGPTHRPYVFKGVFRAEQLARGEARRVPHPKPRPQLPECRKIVLRGMGYRILPPRPERNLYQLNVTLAEENIFAERHDYPLEATEKGQTLMPPWFQRDDLGHEELQSPYPGMFSDYVHFMETTVEKAIEEYLLEVRTPPTEQPPEPDIALPVVSPDVPPEPPDPSIQIAPRPPAISRWDGPTADEAPKDPTQSCPILPDAPDQQTRVPVAPPPPAKPFIYSGWTVYDKPSPPPAEPTPLPHTATIPVQPAVTETAGDIPPVKTSRLKTGYVKARVVPKPPIAAAKIVKRGRFHPGMYAVPGFQEFLEKQAIDVFVPSNWEGIKCPPIEFNFRPDMPDIYRGKARPINPARAPIVKKEFERLEKYHLVPSTSSIVSPITDADKATAPFVRLCGDYRYINKQILHDHQFIPQVRYEIEKLRGFKYFIDLDMVNSFHQFKLALKTSERLSVITPWKTVRPVFMPEGVSPATGVLQAHMKRIFKDFEEWAVVIFDNFCIGGHSHEDLFDKLKLFIARCKEFNIFLKLSKCYFGHSSVKFFGYEVDGNGWCIDDERKAAIRAIPFPTGPNAKAKITRMQSFLGFSLYFRDFVDNYSTKAAQLYDMTVKTFSWSENNWTRDYRVLFEEFKEDMCDSFKLIFPDYTLPWILQPDASSCGIGAILFQVRTMTGADGVKTTRREPIACVSQKFSDAATRWAVIKQEMYAIFKAVDKLSYYLKHKPFQVQTDHSNLVQMEKSSVGIITRWRCFLQSFPITSIIHIAGKDNVAADFLSRMYEHERDVYEDGSSTKPNLATLHMMHQDGPSASDKFLQDPCPNVLAATNLTAPMDHAVAPPEDELEGATAQERRHFLAAVCDAQGCSQQSHCHDSYCAQCGDETGDVDGLLASLSEHAPQAHRDTYTQRVPAFDAIIEQVHGNKHLHFGALATWRLLKQECVGHRIPMEYVRFYVRGCPVCQKYRKTLDRDRIPHVIRHLKAPGPRSTIGIDGFSVTPVDKHGNSYMHVIVNHFTKHVFLYPSKSKDAESAANAIITYISMFGRFTRLISDPGSDYTANVAQLVKTYFGYEHAFSLVDRHESNGVETTNRELLRHVRTLVHDGRFADRWSEPQVLGLITYHINNMRNSESGYSAFDCTFGTHQSEFFKTMDVESAVLVKDSDFIAELTKDIVAVQEASAIFQAVLADTRATDLSLPRNEWMPGDYVFLDNLSPAHKLQAPRLGPYIVVSQHRNDVMLQDIVMGTTKGFHVDRLSIFDGTHAEAFDLAMRDRRQHLVENISGYRGDVEKRETMEFLVHFTDDDSPTWKNFDKDLSDTVAFENYCSSLPQLAPLLVSAAEAARRKTVLLKTRTEASHHKGDVIYVDLRNRTVFEHEWYNALVLEEKDIRHRYVRLVVGDNVRVPGAKVGTRVELIDEAFGLVHRASAYLLKYNGSLCFEQSLPRNSEVVTRDFAAAHPFVPLNEYNHRVLKEEEREPQLNAMTTASNGDTFRICSLNINGWKSARDKGLLQQLQDMPGGTPDVLFLQETKVAQIDEVLLANSLKTIGYKHVTLVASENYRFGGVLTASKTPFTLLGNSPAEKGRAMAVRVEGVTAINLYAPIVWNRDQRFLDRREAFDDAASAWIQELPEPHIIGGDINGAASSSRDLCIPNRMQSGTVGFCSMEERRFFRILESAGYSDVFRDLNQTTSAFTTFPEGKYKGFKARVDYFLASSDMQPSIKACTIRPRTIVSDHAAIEITLQRLGTNLWFDFANWNLLPMPKIDPAWSKPKIPIMPQRIVIGMVLMGPPPPPPPRGAAAEVTGSAVDDVQLVAAITDAQLEAMMIAHDEAVAAEVAAADFDRQLAAMVNAHDAAAAATTAAAAADDVQLAADITDAQLEDMMKAHEEAEAAEAPTARQRIDRANANEEYRISSLEAFARSERQRIALQRPRDPLLTPTRELNQWIPQSPFSPTRPPILPVTPPRAQRRRIQPARVPQSVAPAPTGPAAPFGTTKEQRARALRWYETEYPTNQKTVRPARAYTEAELELMLQPTPSPPPRDDSQRKLTAAERDELDEEERKLTAAEQLVLAAEEAKEEEHAQSRPQTPVRSPPRSIPHFSPMTPEEGEMPTTHDYLQKCDDVVIDWSIPAVSDAMLRVGPSRYGCYRGGAVVDAVGDALSAVVDIAAGQAIASFNGTRITMAEARQMQEEDQGRYLIQIDDDQVLDCKAQATARPPLCFASNANQAQGLLLHGRILTIDHNNAAVEITLDTDDVTQAILYAVVPIPATQDIMWSYGEEFAGGFEEEHSTLSTIATDSSSNDEEKEEGEEGDTSVSLRSAETDERFALQARGGVARHRQVIARLERIGFDARDPFPEYAFGNEDDSVDTVIPGYAGEPLPPTRQEPFHDPLPPIRQEPFHDDFDDYEYHHYEYHPADSDDSVEDPLEPYINYDDGL